MLKQEMMIGPKGQVVIPQEIREQMKIESGTKFAVYGRGDTIIFKRVELPTVRDFERLVAFAAVEGIFFSGSASQNWPYPPNTSAYESRRPPNSL